MTTMPFYNRRVFRGLIILLFALGFTIFSVLRSFEKGRLGNIPNYDDVTYFMSATDLVQSVKQEGFSGLLDFLSRDGLHSPYSTGLASLSYFICGFHDFAPYAANGVVVAAYLCGLGYFLRNCSTLAFSLVLWMFLMLPFATMAVVEFRPDLAWATVTGFAAVFALTSESFFDRGRVVTGFGVLVGIALLIKPTTFAMTILVSCAALGGRWLVEFARTNPGRAKRMLIPSIFISCGSALLVASPYFAFHWRDTWSYFFDNSFGKHARDWGNPSGSVWDHWLFYITGEGARSNLGRQCWIVLPAMLMLGAQYFRQSSLVERLKTASLGIIMAVVYCINSTVDAKTPFLGGAFYGLLFFSVAYVAGRVLPRLEAASTQLKPANHRGLVILAIVMTCFYRWPDYSKWPRNERILCILKANWTMEQYLATYPPPKSILFTQAGPVVPEHINIFYLRRGERFGMNSGAFFRSMDEFTARSKTVEMIITQDKETPGGYPYLPAESLQDEIVSTLKSDRAFQLSKTIPITAEKNVYVFTRMPERPHKAD